MAYYYLKLYHEILDDPKMGRLPDRLYRRVIEIFLIASASNDRDGFLPPVDDMAWKLHLSPDDLSMDLTDIETTTQIVKLIDGRWHVTNFAKRQAAVTVNERVKRYRDREHTSNDSVTNRYTELRVKNLDIDKEIEERGGISNNDGRSSVSSASAVSYFHDIDARECVQVYCEITKQPTVPPDQIDFVINILKFIIPLYDDKQKLIDAGMGYFVRWCNTRGKNGRSYSPTNTAWLNKWYEALAPIPNQPERKPIEYSGALCGTGQALKRKAEDLGDRDHEQAILIFRKHVDECRICGGKTVESNPMPEEVKAKLRNLTKGKVINNET